MTSPSKSKPGNKPVQVWDRAAFLAAVLYVAYLTVLLWEPLSNPRLVWGTGDMTLVYPMRHYWVECLKAGDPAFWEPFASLGQPLPEMMNYSVFSPFSLLCFVLPLGWALTWVSFAHLFLAAFGTCLFIRALGGGSWGSFLGGLAFAFSSFFMAHTYSGAVNFVWAASWFPLVLFLLKRFTGDFKASRLAAAGILMALQVLEGHPQMTYYSILMMVLFLFFLWVRKEIRFGQFLLGCGLPLIVAALLSLCQWLPSWRFAMLSNRWDWTYKDIMTDYTNPGNLRYFLNPFFMGSPLDNSYVVTGHWGYHEMATYIGLIPLFLAVAGLALVRRKPLLGWFWALALLFTVLAMGDSTSLSHWVFRFFYDFFPAFSHNRAMARVMLLTLFCLSCAAGLTLEGLRTIWNRLLESWAFKRKKLVRVLAAALPALLVVASAVDLWHYGKGFVITKEGDFYLRGLPMFPGEAWDTIKKDKTSFRAQSGYLADFEMDARVNQPLSEFTYTILIKEAYDCLQALRTDWNTPLSDLVGLKYLYSPSYFNHPNGRWKPLSDGTIVNTQVLPRAFVVGGYALVTGPSEALGAIQAGNVDIRGEVLLEKVPMGNASWKNGYLGEAAITHYGNCSAVMNCKMDQPGFLFLSDSYYPGWHAWVDGVEKPILRADGVFRAVALEQPGNHQIRMEYRPVLLYVCSWITLGFWLLLALALGFRAHIRTWFVVPCRWFGAKI